MPANAFVYGTLMADEVLNLLIKRVPTHRPAVLHGYTRYRIKNRVYPAIIPTAPTDTVQGKVRPMASRGSLCGPLAGSRTPTRRPACCRCCWTCLLRR